MTDQVVRLLERGAVGSFLWRGPYDVNADYVAGDHLSHGGRTWRVRRTVRGVAPPTGATVVSFTDDYELVSDVGVQGPQGAASTVPGPQGIPGESPRTVRAAASGITSRSGAPVTVDGVSIAAGERVFDYGNTDATLRGVWVVAGGAWTRDSVWTAVPRAPVYVLEGTHAGMRWNLTNAEPVVIGTTALTFQRDDLVAMQDYVQQQLANSRAQNHIRGLDVRYVDDQNYTVTPGEAYVPGANGGAGGVVSLAASHNISVAALTANTLYHVYLTDLGAVAVDSTTKPSVPYLEDAKTMTGLSTHRYLDSLLVAKSATLRFVRTVRGAARDDRMLRETQDTAIPRNSEHHNLRVLAYNTTTTPHPAFVSASTRIEVSVLGVVPSRASAVLVQIRTPQGPTVSLDFNPTTSTAHTQIMRLDPDRTHAPIWVPLNETSTALRFFYFLSAAITGGTFTIDVIGWRIGR